jgi:hypothetical protein
MDFDETEMLGFFTRLFPGGLRHPALLAELCPEGWERSPLFACMHPSPERCYEEHCELRQTMKSFDDELRARMPAEYRESGFPEDPELSFEEFLAEYPEETMPPTPLTAEAGVAEPAELLALCLWDVFGDNHWVITEDGEGAAMETLGELAGVIAEFHARAADAPEWRAADEDMWEWHDADPLRFEMGTCWVAGRADLTPVYRMIFRRLRAVGADWEYGFPRLYLYEPPPVDDGSFSGYDPSAALQRETERKAREAETRRRRRRLDRAALAAKREARRQQAPAMVLAYQEVYGRFPIGWPPDPYDPT